jgi:outer membrane immunogenic protein
MLIFQSEINNSKCGEAVKNLVLVSAAVASLLATPVMAADLPVKAPAYNAPPAPMFTWTGCYVGINGGGIRNGSTLTTYDNTPGLNSYLQAALTADHDFTNTAGTAGGQAGCNLQSDKWVFGVEGDANWSGLNQTLFTAFPNVPAGPGNIGFDSRNETLSQSVDWFATIRGRAGFVFQQPLLLYATAGVAFGKVNSSLNVQDTLVPANTWLGSGNSTRGGWTAGAGAEYALVGNWSAKLEYLYVDLGTFTVSASIPGSPTQTWADDVHTRFHVFRAGLNYKIGSPAP